MTIQVDKDQHGNFYLKQTYFFGVFSGSYIDIGSIKRYYTNTLDTWSLKDAIDNLCKIKTEEEMEEVIRILKKYYGKSSSIKFTKYKSVKIK